MTEMKITNGIITIVLPGLTAVRIDTETRVIAVDYISGGEGSGPTAPKWLVHDLRGKIYGDFHTLKDRDECNDPECERSGQHVTPYPHVHETIEDVTACTECMDRAAELRILADV